MGHIRQAQMHSTTSLNDIRLTLKATRYLILFVQQGP